MSEKVRPGQGKGIPASTAHSGVHVVDLVD